MRISSGLCFSFCTFALGGLPACASASGEGQGAEGLLGDGGTAEPGAGGNGNSSGVVPGITGTGGFVATGGVLGTGGVPGTGSGPGTGSVQGTGGAPGTGGAAATGGAPGAGGELNGGGAGGAGDTGGMGGAGTEPEPPSECITKSSQVILMGDSYMNWVSHTFQTDLYAEAGQTFRSYAIGAYSMGSGGIGFIPTQWDTAVAADPDIKVIVLDGGGNDILVPDLQQFPQGGSCRNDLNAPNIPDCQAIVEKAIDTAVSLMDTVVSQGVTDVVYFFYPHVPEGTLIGGAHPNAILDYALPKVKAACDGAEAMTGGQLRCHFVDLVPVFAGHTDWFAAGDIHPNTMGSQAMARAVWQKMTDVCIGQTAASGCCVAP